MCFMGHDLKTHHNTPIRSEIINMVRNFLFDEDV